MIRVWRGRTKEKPRERERARERARARERGFDWDLRFGKCCCDAGNRERKGEDGARQGSSMGAARGSDGVVVDNNTDRCHKAHQQLGGSRVHVAVLVSIANLGCNLLDCQSKVFFTMGDSQSGYFKADAWTFEILHLWKLKC
jgi:hypothetical protein